MALGPIHCGSLLLFIAFALLLVATISAPVVSDLSFLNIKQNGNGNVGKVTMGVFGYCSDLRSFSSGCTDSHVGYNIVQVVNSLGREFRYNWQNETLENLTKVLILHPIAMGLTFFSILITLCADRIGFICAAFIAFLAFIVSLVAMIFDFVIFGIVKHEINDHTEFSASYSTATWLVLAATIILFFSTFIVFFTCCTNSRRSRKEYDAPYNSGGYVGNAGPDMGYASTSRPWYRRFGGNRY